MYKANYWQGFWRLADPKVSLASFAGLFMAACLAAADSGLQMPWLIVTVLGIFCVEVAKNASGEVVDYDSGTDLAIVQADRSPFSGGKRVLVDGLMSRRQTWQLAGLFFSTAIIIGLCIAYFREPRILGLGVIGMGLAWFYHGGSVRLSYRGLGETAVFLAYGPLVVCGTYLVQTGYLSTLAIHLSLILGLLVGAFLWINQFPDYLADKASGKRNLVVRLGRQRASLCYVVIVATAYTWLFLVAIYLPGSRGILAGLAGLPAAVFSAWRLVQSPKETPTIIPAQVACLGSFVLAAVCAGLGYYFTSPA
jgi:1,4-dihydroxy-2-naphthoate polyprenyltransferase